MVPDSLPSGSSSGHIPEYMCLEPLANLPEWFFIIINWLHQFIIYSFKDSDIKFSQDLLPSLIPAKRCSSPLLYRKKLVCYTRGFTNSAHLLFTHDWNDPEDKNATMYSRIFYTFFHSHSQDFIPVPSIYKPSSAICISMRIKITTFRIF